MNVIDHILEDISMKLMQKQQKELIELVNFDESKIDGKKKRYAENLKQLQRRW